MGITSTGCKINVGDKVRHRRLGWVGIVSEFQKRNGGVLVNLSDDKGIKYRWIHILNLEVINDSQ